MAFCFKLNETLCDGAQRIVSEQIDIADRELSRTTSLAKRVHKARKCCKRIRALFRLTREATGKKIYRKENKRFRDIARGLAGARDLSVMIDTLETLKGHGQSKSHERLNRSLRSLLVKQKKDSDPDFKRLRITESREALDRARKSVGNNKFGNLEITQLAEGLRNCYQVGQKKFAIACRDYSPENIHEFRKSVQTHWRHMQLLAAAWPEVFSARIVMAEEISQLLGDHNDLDLLKCYLSQHGHKISNNGELRSFSRASEKIQMEFRLQAYPKSKLLFSESAAQFADRICLYWETARGFETT